MSKRQHGKWWIDGHQIVDRETNKAMYTDENRYNMKMIQEAVACVNALDGMDPEAVVEVIEKGRILSRSAGEVAVVAGTFTPEVIHSISSSTIIEVNDRALKEFNQALAKLEE